jgi:hypothetical protein
MKCISNRVNSIEKTSSQGKCRTMRGQSITKLIESFINPWEIVEFFPYMCTSISLKFPRQIAR